MRVGWRRGRELVGSRRRIGGGSVGVRRRFGGGWFAPKGMGFVMREIWVRTAARETAFCWDLAEGRVNC